MRSFMKKTVACAVAAAVMMTPAGVFASNSIGDAPIANAPAVTNGYAADAAIKDSVVAAPEADTTEGKLKIQYHSQGDIKAFVEAHPVKFLGAEYTTEPSLATKEPGVLKDTVLTDVLNALNICRYIAGLSYNITIDPEYQKKTQAAAFVNFANSSMSHYPSVPNGWSETDPVYVLGKAGAGSSNLAAGFGSLADALFNGWMDDGDASNIDRVGHRRWVLNPYMTSTGFGQAGFHTAMYAFGYDSTAFWGYGSKETEKKVSVWPAPNMPVDYFDGSCPWSYSTGENETGDVKVSLKNVNTGKTWSFSSTSADGYFNVQNGNYGIKGCVIFRPESVTINAGDEYEVKITGLVGGDVDYTVDFFSLAATEATVPDSDFDPTKDNYQGWYVENGKNFWYENGVRQGDEKDAKNFSYDGSVRGREIYDPVTNGWYWLDVIYGGAKASNKEVFMPYIYQTEADHLDDENWINTFAQFSNRTTPDVVDFSAQIAKAIKAHGGKGAGKWVRYDSTGKMIKGWYTVTGSDSALYPKQVGNTYYYDHQTGLMAKGLTTINGEQHYFDEVTGALKW